MSKKKQEKGREADQSESFRANKIRRQTVSFGQFEQLSFMTTKSKDRKGRTKPVRTKYMYWTDDDGDKFKIVSQWSGLRMIIAFKNEDGSYEESKFFKDEGYEADRKFTAPIMDSDMAKLIPDDEYEPEMLRGGRRIRGGKYKKLAEATCGEKRGYPTRATTMCVLVNKSRKSRKRPCLNGKVRRGGGRCAPGAKTPCNKEGQVRRKNSKGKYECRKKSSRNKKTIKQRQAECREKGKVYNRKSGRCRNKKKPKKKKPKKKSSNKKKKPKGKKKKKSKK